MDDKNKNEESVFCRDGVTKIQAGTMTMFVGTENLSELFASDGNEDFVYPEIPDDEYRGLLDWLQ